MAHHVVLVGLMGSGKTTVGRRLATRLDRQFVDADDALVEITERTIAEVFATDGEERFRALEADVLEELLEHHQPHVIASGGGVVLREDNRRRLHEPEVTVVWLDADPAFLASRIAKREHRPLLAGEETPRDVLVRLHAERAPLYRDLADITVDVQPFHLGQEHPKRALAEHIERLVRDHERARVSSEAGP